MGGDDPGFTLVEVAVSSAIFMVVMLLVWQGIIVMQNAVSATDTRQDVLGEVRIATNAVGRAVRTAAPAASGTSAFLVADDVELVFTGNLDPTVGPRRIRYAIDAEDRLVQEITEPVPVPPPSPAVGPPTYTYPGTPKARVLANSIANETGAKPMFVYYDSTGATLATPVVGTALLDVHRVDVIIVARRPSDRPSNPTVEIRTTVRLPNVTLPTPTPAPGP